MPKKIFELAKELEMGAIDLVEELKANGFNVRNHMNSLSDDEVDKAVEIIKAKNAPADDAAGKKKKAKKKTAKKKTATKKKTVKKKVSKASSASSDSDVEEEAKTSKKKAVKRKTVVRKKSAKKETSSEDTEQSETIEDSKIEAKSEVDSTSTESVETEETSKKEDSKSGGLRIVSRPKKDEVKKEAAKEDESSTETKKQHKFTPVYIPEKSESEGSKDEKDLGPGKKKLGGLAAMMSGKAKNKNKSAEINQVRADLELKSYSALSSTGRPLYTPVGRKKIYTGSTKQTRITELKDSKRVVQIHDSVTIEELSNKLSVKSVDLIDECLKLNLLLRPTDYIGLKLCEQIAELYNFRVENKAFDEDAVLGKKVLSDDEKEKLPTRAPVVAIMGHVDHGKTTLLDHIRKAKVASGEAGGITQHIGAYTVKASGKDLTFLDTPGHAAFGAMRQRGAALTDIVILVVAADDGVMPQTKESIRYCKEAGVDIIVAVNKMDKEAANPDRVKQELSEFEIMPEEWGGTHQFCHVSALKGDGIDELLEAVALQSEMLELRAQSKGKAKGCVIESRIESGRGPMATVLVQTGTLKKGDSIVVGETYGRARSLIDFKGDDLKSAGPSVPVQILGLNEAPTPGDELYVVKNEREAKKIVDNRIKERKDLEAAPEKKKLSLEDFFGTKVENESKTLNVIIRSDVQGSFEAIKQALESLGNEEVGVKVLAGGVGAITENDVQLAANAEGFIFGFNMRPVTSARKMADQKGVDIKTYSVIYELINDVKLALEGLLDPEYVEEFIGRAEVKDTFVVPKIGTIAGSSVIDGKIQFGCNIRLLREGKIVFDGKLSSLKRFKDDVKEVKNGYECGIGLDNFNDIKINDLFEAYMMIEKKRKLSESGEIL